MCRILRSIDDFKTIHSTDIIYYSTEIMDRLSKDEWYNMSQDSIRQIREMWRNTRWCNRKDNFEGRIYNALSYYFSAWRSHSIEQAIINLTIVLELLFAPHSQSEISHQVSFNVSKFLGSTKEERIEIYDAIKKVYGVRSAIIHGGIPKLEKVEKCGVIAQSIVSRLMFKIMSSKDTLYTFSDDGARKTMLSKFMFD